MSDLIGMLAEHGLTRLPSYQAGRRVRSVCPDCHGGRQKEQCLSVEFSADGGGAVWHCHRATCGKHGGVRLPNADQSGYREPPPPKRVAPMPHREQPKPPALYEFWKARGISEDTVDAFGIYVTRHWFPAIGEPGAPSHHPAGEHPAMVFPYVWQGQLRNRKYRPPWKHPQAQDKDALPTVFNADSITATGDPVIWVEGEPDVLALHEAGYRQIVSLKDGAVPLLKRKDDETDEEYHRRQEDALTREDDHRFAAFATHADLLGRCKRFVLAPDADAPGRLLREALARRLGRHRCWLVTWPEGIKDANDMLVQRGRDALIEAIDGAEPYPLDGVHTVQAGLLGDLRGRPEPPTMTTGCGAVDEVLRFPTEGRLIVVTGIPSHGKSVMMTNWAVHQMKNYRRRWAVFSPEMSPWQEYVGLVAEILVGKPLRWKRDATEIMTDQEMAAAEKWLRDRLVLLEHDDAEHPPTLNWLLDLARTCVLRFGITDLAIDPWTELEHAGDSDNGSNSVEHLRRALQRLTAFSKQHGVNVWVVAHPTKLLPPKPGAKIPAPTPYDIAGGAQWYNKASIIVTVHRAEEGQTELYTRKIRFRRFGQTNKMVRLGFNTITSTYRSYDVDPPLQGGYNDI